MTTSCMTPQVQPTSVPFAQQDRISSFPNVTTSAMNFAEPKPRLLTYNGKQDWDAFYVKFEFLATQFGWDENKKLSYLMAG